MSAIPTSRMNYLDWLRVLLILTVYFFHSNRFFDLDDWQIKNSTTYFGPLIIVYFLSSWMMPLIFVVSAASIYHALGRTTAGRFAGERVLRLLVPWLVGVFSHVTLQVYLERVSHGQFSGTFWQFYPAYIGSIPSGGFAWSGYHLWYLQILFVFSLICLPLFWWLRRGGAGLLARLGQRLSGPAVYLPMLLVMLLAALLDPGANEYFNFNSYGGWNIPSYLVFFLGGFVIGSSQPLQAAIQRLRRTSYYAGLATTILCFGAFALAGKLEFGTPAYLVVMLSRGMTGWCWVLYLYGSAMQRLNARTPFLDYANEAVLPFYILHQTVLIVIGYFVVQSGLPDLLKWALIVTSSLAVIMVLYEFLIRRSAVLRFLFGMKPLKKAIRTAPVPAAA